MFTYPARASVPAVGALCRVLHLGVYISAALARPHETYSIVLRPHVRLSPDGLARAEL